MLVLTYFRNLFRLVVGGRQEFRWRALVGGVFVDGWRSLMYVFLRRCALLYPMRELLFVRVVNFLDLLLVQEVAFVAVVFSYSGSRPHMIRRVHLISVD